MIIPTTIIAAAAALIAIPSIAAPLNPSSSVVGLGSLIRRKRGHYWRGHSERWDAPRCRQKQRR